MLQKSFASLNTIFPGCRRGDGIIMWGTMRGSNRLFTMQNAAQRRSVRAAARPFDVRARPRRPPTLREMRQGRQAPGSDAASARPKQPTPGQRAMISHPPPRSAQRGRKLANILRGVKVGTIRKVDGFPPQWEWRCGFYPRSAAISFRHRRSVRSGAYPPHQCRLRHRRVHDGHHRRDGGITIKPNNR